jgi:hypothetical protein
MSSTVVALVALVVHLGAGVALAVAPAATGRRRRLARCRREACRPVTMRVVVRVLEVSAVVVVVKVVAAVVVGAGVVMVVMERQSRRCRLTTSSKRAPTRWRSSTRGFTSSSTCR